MVHTTAFLINQNYDVWLPCHIRNTIINLVNCLNEHLSGHKLDISIITHINHHLKYIQLFNIRKIIFKMKQIY